MHSQPNNSEPVWVYPFNFAPTEDYSDYQRDERGVPQVYYPHLRRWVYNPITIAQFGLTQLSRYAMNQEQEAATAARTMAGWFVENLEDWKNGIGAWVYRFDLPFYGPTAPWISAMAQGQGISLLLRVHQLFPHAAFEAASHRAVQAFYHDLKTGGVARTFPDGHAAFEEYTTTAPSLVLNGMLFALLGLHDYASHFADRTAAQCFAQGLAGVKANLWRYDTGYWNFYDLHRSRRLTSPDYIRIHVQLLRLFAQITQDDFFAQIAQRWETYLHSKVCRAHYVAVKCVEKVRLFFRDYSAT